MTVVKTQALREFYLLSDYEYIKYLPKLCFLLYYLNVFKKNVDSFLK